MGALLPAAATAAALALPGNAGGSRPVEFAREVRPIFERRCTACHGRSQQKGGLRLHRKADALAGGDTGLVIVPGAAAKSRLVQYVAGEVEAHRMPPNGPPLSPNEVSIIRRWVDEGASWPESADDNTPAQLHWSFRPLRRPPVPAVHDASWVRNPIDAFVLAELQRKKLRPSPLADRRTLIRRVSLDLTGLPPAPKEVDAFLNDHRPGAYDRVVDRLLASPAYGERWARPWLDLARYADSDGYTIDSPRQMWPYRDWVIRALNADMPFNEFTIEQLAGDLLPNATQDQKIATGFHRNTLINEEGGTDPEQFRVESVVDRVNTTGSVWLGLTVGCAQCHSHKFDPISQREYYQLFAFFNDQDEPKLQLGSADTLGELKKVRAEVARLKAQQKPGKGTGGTESSDVANRLKEAEEKEKALADTAPVTLVLQERTTPRQSFVHLRGDFLRHGIEVFPGVPSVLPLLKPAESRPTRLDLAKWLVDGRNPLPPRVTVNRIWQSYFGRGLVETENDFGTQGDPPTNPSLLEWLATEFVSGAPAAGTYGSGGVAGYGSRGEADGGQGVRVGVRTEAPRPLTPTLPHSHTSSPGVQEPLPTAWSLKRLHRLIVTSATYMQSSSYRQDLAAVDPGNRLLGRQNRLRLDAEGIRDVALATSGLLSHKIGGPSVFPPQPPGTEVLTQVKRVWTPSAGEDRYRRGLYTWHWRSNPYPLFVTFDGPNRTVTCTRRMRSDTPTQALMLANDASLFELAQGLAARLLREGSADDAARLRTAFRLCLSREPSDRERERLLGYLAEQRRKFEASPDAAKSAAPANLPAEVRPAEGAAWTATARVLMNLDEFITRE